MVADMIIVGITTCIETVIETITTEAIMIEDVMIVGISSRCRDPVEFSGTFWSISLVYKFCNSLYLLIGLQRNTLYSKSNQCATAFLQQW